MARSGPCILCDSGDIDPSIEIQLPGYSFIETCGALDSILPSLFTADSAECTTIRSINTLCGCPLPPDACSLCGAQSCEGEILGHGDAELPFFSDRFLGNAPTCEIFEKYVQSIPYNDTLCQLGSRYLGDYCGCHGRLLPTDAPKCSLCGGTPQNVNIFANQLRRFESEKGINITGFPFSTCKELAEATETLLLDNSGDCLTLQEVFSDYCGCPARLDSCSLCRDGSSVTFPDQTLPFLSDEFLGLVPTCAVFESMVASYGTASEDCVKAQKLGSYCGCPPVENACQFCQEGEITQPQKEIERLERRFGFLPTCEMVQAMMLQTVSSEQDCSNIQQLNYLCGCNDGLFEYYGTQTVQQQAILSTLPRVTGSLSLVGALFIITDCIRKGLPSVYHTIMILMAIFDSITAITWIVGNAAVPPIDKYGENFPVYGAHGTELTCTLHGFFVQLGFGSIFYNNSLNLYYLLVVVFGWLESKLEKIKLYLYTMPALCAAILAFAGLPFYEALPFGCYIPPHPFAETNTLVTIFGALWILITALFSTFAMIAIYVKVRRQEDRSEQYSSQFRGAASQRRQKMSRRVFYQGAFYLFNFYISWPILVHALLLAANTSFMYWAVVFSVAPIQGWTNFMIYVRPRMLRYWGARQRARKHRLRNHRTGSAVSAQSQTFSRQEQSNATSANSADDWFVGD